LHHDKLFEEMTKRQIDMEQRIVDAVSSKRQKVTDHSDGAAHLEPSTSTTVNFSFQVILPWFHNYKNWIRTQYLTKWSYFTNIITWVIDTAFFFSGQEQLVHL
jgi:hypothetical protein